MSKVQVTADGLRALYSHAKSAGTIGAWAEVALEWADKAESELARLKAIVDKLPKTADGLVVIPGRDQVFSPKGQGMEYELWWGPDSFDDERHGQWLAMDENYRSIGGCSTYFPLASDCYSTREAAEAAKRGGHAS